MGDEGETEEAQLFGEVLGEGSAEGGVWEEDVMGSDVLDLIEPELVGVETLIGGVDFFRDPEETVGGMREG